MGDIMFFVIPIGILIAYLIYHQIREDKKVDSELPETIKFNRKDNLEPPLTNTLAIIQNWGWFIGIIIFLGLVATLSICQVVNDIQYWKLLSAGWWFVVFYATSSVILYLVTDKIKSIRRERKQEQTMEQTTDNDNMEQTTSNLTQTIGTRDLFLETLTKIGCQYELSGEENDNRIFFAYQGEHLFADAQNDARFVHVYDPNWGQVELYEIEKFANLKKVINEANMNYYTTTFYTINEAGSTADVHSRVSFLFIPEIPQIDDYLRSVLDNFFRVHQFIGSELAKLEALEESK